VRIALGVAVFGAAGSLSRWLLSTLVQRHAGAGFPLGTLTVNVLGSIAIGAVMGFFVARGAESSGLRVVLTAGFLGGFTTYSSFAFETLQLLGRRSFGLALVNFAGTSVVCLGGCALGVLLGRALAR
jgi:CrcB protein